MSRSAGVFAISVIVIQVIIVALYVAFVRYGNESLTVADATSLNGTTSPVNEVTYYYGVFQDVHVMIFFGFGFLMTFLHKYSWGGIGMNYLIAVVVIQWAVLVNGFWHQVYDAHWKQIYVSIPTLITSDFAAGAALISFGAIIGKPSPTQYIWIAIVEIIIYGANEMIGALEFGAVDMGGSMYVHTFGAFFGAACAWMFGPKAARDHPNEGTDYASDRIAMAGTIFLFMFWPSFNGALANSLGRNRVIINTYLSIAASALTTFAASRFFRKSRKFNMIDIQNATLAGGVAVGSSADLVIQPWGAVIVGAVAGVVSTWGYVFIKPWLEEKIHLHDTAGVLHLHGIPGIIGAIGGAISAALATDEEYGQPVWLVFPKRAPADPNNAELVYWQSQGYDVGPGDDRTAVEQGGYQIAALIVTLALSISGGLVVGYLAKKVCKTPEDGSLFDDTPTWEKEEEEELLPHSDERQDHDAENEIENVELKDLKSGSSSARYLVHDGESTVQIMHDGSQVSEL